MRGISEKSALTTGKIGEGEGSSVDIIILCHGHTKDGAPFPAWGMIHMGGSPEIFRYRMVSHRVSLYMSSMSLLLQGFLSPDRPKDSPINVHL